MTMKASKFSVAQKRSSRSWSWPRMKRNGSGATPGADLPAIEGCTEGPLRKHGGPFRCGLRISRGKEKERHKKTATTF